MKKALFIKYINQLFKDYDTTIRYALKGAKEEHIHDLRILIKRLNALFLFLNESGIYRKKPQSYFNRLKNFFKSAGILRDIQVQRSLIANYKNNNNLNLAEYETYLVDRENKAKFEFFRISADYPKQEQIQVKKDIISSIKAFGQQKLTDKAGIFIIKRLDLIGKYLFHPDTGKYFHKIRQTLKQLRYFIEIYQFCSEPNLLNEIDLDEVKEIENILGRWNDRVVLTEDMKRYNLFMKKVGASFSDNAMVTLLKQIKAEMKKIVSDIRPRLLKLTYHLKYIML